MSQESNLQNFNLTTIETLLAARGSAGSARALSQDASRLIRIAGRVTAAAASGLRVKNIEEEPTDAANVSHTP